MTGTGRARADISFYFDPVCHPETLVTFHP
jgi:hypothetical protein